MDDIVRAAGDPAYLRQWLGSLTLVNVAESSSRILELLEALEDVTLGPGRQQALLDMVGESVAMALDSLDEHIGHMRFPIDANTAAIANLADRLCAAMADAYYRIFQAHRETGWLNQNLHAGLWVTCAQRVLHYSFLIVRNRGMIDEAPPEGLWKRVHSLQQWAVRKRVAGRRVGAPRNYFSQPCSFEEYYKNILLLACIKLPRVDLAQIDEITRSLPLWSADLELVPCSRSGGGRVLHLYVDPALDAGPLEYHPSVDLLGDELLLDTAKLDAHFARLTRRMEEQDSETVDLDTGGAISLMTLRLLKVSWVIGGDRSVHGSDVVFQSPEEWVESLEVTDVRESSRRIYNLLKHLNGREMPLLRRFGFLEVLTQPAEVICSNLRRKYGEVRFPIEHRVVMIGDLVDDLAQMMVEGWQLVIEQWRAGSWVAQSLHPRIPRTAAYWIFRYSEMLIENGLLLNRPVREGTWLRLHRLYRRTREEGWLENSLQADAREQSARDLYVQCLLMSLSGMQGLRAQQVREVHDTLGVWAREVGLRNCNEVEDFENLPFRLHLEEDQPPLSGSRHGSDRNDQECVLLDVSGLYARLSQVIAHGERKGQDPVTLEGGRKVSLATLRYLRKVWRRGASRQGKRMFTLVAYQAVFSIGVSHYLLCSHEELQQSEQDGEGAVNGVAVRELPRNRVVEEIVYCEDLMESIFPNGGASTHNWSPQTDLSHRDFMRVIVLDYSRGGCRFRFRPTVGDGIHVGDVVTLRKQSGREVLCGYVRWIRSLESGELMVGVRFLAHNVLPVGVSIMENGREQSQLPGLLGQCIEQGLGLLLLPVIPGIRRKQLDLRYKEKVFPIYLAGLPVEQSRAFDAFRFGVAKENRSEPLLGDEKVTLKRLDQLTADESPQQESNVREESVWDLL